jgi:hypothetical protein
MEQFHRPLIIYHGRCPDGFCAAWVANRYFRQEHVPVVGELEFVEANYGECPPDVSGRDVYILDFSYPRAQMVQLLASARSLVVLEHHKTAEAELKGLSSAFHFDNNRSGASMAWDLFFGGQRSWLVAYVEDRDLWRKALPDTEEVNAYISTLPFEFNEWDAQHDMGFRDSIVERGHQVVQKVKQYVRETAKLAIWINFDGYQVPIVNAPNTNISEVLRHLIDNTSITCNEPSCPGFEHPEDLHAHRPRFASAGVSVTMVDSSTACAPTVTSMLPP